jgi:hypothetical protein
VGLICVSHIEIMGLIHRGMGVCDHLLVYAALHISHNGIVKVDTGLVHLLVLYMCVCMCVCM